MDFIKGNSQTKHVSGRLQDKSGLLSMHAWQSSRMIWVKGGRGNGLGCGKLLHMLDQVRTTTSFRNQHVAEDRGVVLTYVRMSISYDQTISKGRLQKTTSILAQVQRGDRQRSHHGTVSPLQCCQDETVFLKRLLMSFPKSKTLETPTCWKNKA